MAVGLLRVNWPGLFRSLTPAAQRRLEFALAENGLLLGEFMELVERAYLEAYLLREASLGWQRLDLESTAQALAARLLRSYIRRKHLFRVLLAARNRLEWARLSGALPGEVNLADLLNDASIDRSSLAASYKLQLRARIHSRIETMKRA